MFSENAYQNATEPSASVSSTLKDLDAIFAREAEMALRL
jgi:hypothetical protein